MSDERDDDETTVSRGGDAPALRSAGENSAQAYTSVVLEGKRQRAPTLEMDRVRILDPRRMPHLACNLLQIRRKTLRTVVRSPPIHRSLPRSNQTHR